MRVCVCMCVIDAGGATLLCNSKGWPDLYISTVYDLLLCKFSAESTVYTPYMYTVLAIAF